MLLKIVPRFNSPHSYVIEGYNMKIALLIPSTSRGRDEWNTAEDTYLWNLTIQTFLTTRNTEHKYTFYIGIDDDDRIYSTDKSKEFFTGKLAESGVDIQFISMSGITKGHLTVMWNRLFQKAYDDGCEYFFQCGDDISFRTGGWVNACVDALTKNNNIGLTGPINNNSRILTQAMVSRKHMEIFGWFFPVEIINWCCDDWYNWIYQPDNFFPLRHHFCSNDGGNPRYVVNNDTGFLKSQTAARKNIMELRRKTATLAMKHRDQVQRYIQNHVSK